MRGKENERGIGQATVTIPIGGPYLGIAVGRVNDSRGRTGQEDVNISSRGQFWILISLSKLSGSMKYRMIGGGSMTTSPILILERPSRNNR